MAFDAFVKFQGGPTDIKGETQDDTYPNAFEISEFSFGAETTLNIGSGTTGAGAGKATFKEFTVKKQTDSASPLLLQVLGTGDHFKTVQLFLRKSGAAAADGKSGKAYLVFAFGMVAVKSIDWSGSSGDDVPTESLIFEYGELMIGYYPQDEKGNLSTSVKSGGWSKLKNSKTGTMVNVDSVKN